MWMTFIYKCFKWFTNTHKTDQNSAPVIKNQPCKRYSAIQCKDGLRKARTDIPSKAVIAKLMKFNVNVVEIISVRGIMLAVY